jgi:carbon monoxide dehydrogenase subunit G
MMNAEVEIAIDASKEAVWEVITDLEKAVLADLKDIKAAVED